MSKIYGILGHPIRHSLSPAMHNAAFLAMEIDARYECFDIEPVDLASFIGELRMNKELKGLSVTIPHKVAIMNCLDQIDQVAQKIGAVNTVVKKDDWLCGTNTDWEGALKALTEVSVLKGKNVLVLGSGGAARAICFGLIQAGAKVTLLARNKEKSLEFKRSFGLDTGALKDIESYHADMIINTTPVGMKPIIFDSLVPISYLNPKMMVFDIVYKPLKTKLIRDSEAKGCITITGEKMLLYQGAKQFELWTGKKAPIEVMRKALLENLGD